MARGGGGTSSALLAALVIGGGGLVWYLWSSDSSPQEAGGRLNPNAIPRPNTDALKDPNTLARPGEEASHLALQFPALVAGLVCTAVLVFIWRNISTKLKIGIGFAAGILVAKGLGL